MGRPRSAWISVASVASVLGAWEFSSRFLIDPFFLPPVSSILIAAVELWSKGLLLNNIVISLFRISVGFVLGSALAIPVGLLIGSSLVIRRIADPCVHFMRFIPALALTSLFVVWFGVGEVSKILQVMYATVFIVIISTATGVAALDPTKAQAARTLGANSWQVFRLITVPATIPAIYTGMRLALAGSFLVIVAVEMLAAESGLGYLIWTSKIYFRTDWMFVGIILLGALGLAADYMWKLVGRRVLRRYVRESANY